MAAFISPHQIGDVIYWTLFVAGQCVWVLICAAAAIRSKQNPIKSRSAYVAMNWDILLIRFIVEWLTIFYLWRHYSVNDLLSFFHATWQFPVNTGNSPVAAIALGLLADVLLNSFAKAKLDKAPAWVNWIQTFLLERIPQVPQEQVATVETTTKITPVNQAIPVTETKTSVSIMAPQEEKE